MIPQTIPKILTNQETPEGEFLLVDKPQGWTSFDVVHFVRKVLRVRKAGHAGTLDPLATGLLLICTGKRTRDMEQFIGLQKEYEVEMTLGGRTESYDAETPVLEQRPTAGITPAAVVEALERTVGPQEQIPPMWSAVKVKGKALYRYARKGVVVDRPPRSIVIHEVHVTSVAMPVVNFRMVCSKGTYVRSLVNTIGEQLQCGAYVTGLRRTRIGGFSVQDAWTVPQLKQRAAETALRPL
jgi:tRNA pseudouridine55 synthase